MQLLDRPESGGNPKPEKPLLGGGGWWVRGKETRAGFFAGRILFVIVGTMFVIMTLTSVFMLWVSWNEPYLAPSITDESLHVNKIYLQYEGETVFHELAQGNTPASLLDSEITQIPLNKTFKIIFTPKQLDIPEKYRIYVKESGQGPVGGLDLKSKYLKETVDGTFYTLTASPLKGSWTPGKYEIEMPDSGMFGGKWYAYFTILNN